MIEVFFKAIGIGFLIAAPVGPIGILCIRRALEGGRVAGIMTGLGAAFGDACYGVIAGFGLTVVSDVLMRYQIALKIVGGIFLIYLGIKAFVKAEKITQEVQGSAGTLFSYFISTFFLVVTNPVTILVFMAIFAGFGLGGCTSYADAIMLVSGIFLGSMLWWVALSELTCLLTGKIKPEYFVWVNRIVGIVLVIFGVGLCFMVLI